MAFTIFGSGFGLYGYLPCLIERFEEEIILQKKQCQILEGREELSKYIGAIKWVDDISEALRLCDGVAIAVPPNEQIKIVNECLKFKNIKKYLLEKPIAVNPAEALKTINAIYISDSYISVGFIFDDLNLFNLNQFRSHGRLSSNALKLEWLFEADHFAKNRDTWKRSHSMGGGVLRFYGIHLISLLRKYGYTTVNSSFTKGVADHPYRWEAQLSGQNLRTLDIVVDSNSPEHLFSLTSESAEVFSYSNPFHMVNNTSASLDSRISPLEGSIKRNISNRDDTYKIIVEGIRFWREIELLTELIN
jgi:hypothetical protein